jgi:NADPH:quinone reductase-like Zn-dependent oxidoreductase
MRAVVHDRYGPPEVLRIDEVDKPVPQADEVLVRVHATTVTQTDCHMRAARPFFWRFMLGLRRPRRRTLGLEFAGVVEAVGADVTELAVGDRVFGLRNGSHAEYVCVREERLIAHIPEGMSFEQAAAVSDGMCEAIAALRAGGVEEGTNLLIYGASGSLGTGAVQLASYLGAHVTAVCGGKNLDLVRSLGAHEVIDYQTQDFTRNGEAYDVILDAVGKHSYLRARRSLVSGGIFVATDRLFHLPLALLTRWLGSTRVTFSVGSPWTRDSVLLLKELLEDGKYRAVVDRVYPVEEIVDATRYVESWQKTGNVVLTLNGAGR